uniref:Uncharacterized protein n=1 Tax=Rhizophora mucronata TaxID=61149 RepID=A0A2P2NQD5_RHIMU
MQFVPIFAATLSSDSSVFITIFSVGMLIVCFQCVSLFHLLRRHWLS